MGTAKFIFPMDIRDVLESKVSCQRSRKHGTLGVHYNPIMTFVRVPFPVKGDLFDNDNSPKSSLDSGWDRHNSVYCWNSDDKYPVCCRVVLLVTFSPGLSRMDIRKRNEVSRNSR